jgi:hypothetical protein
MVVAIAVLVEQLETIWDFYKSPSCFQGIHPIPIHSVGKLSAGTPQDL